MKITKKRLIEIIKEEINVQTENSKDTLNEDKEMEEFEAESAGSDEELSGYLEGLGIPLDKDGNPTKKPPLPKNWRTMPIKSVERRAFRMWYTTYGPGSKPKRNKPKRSDFHPDVREALASADARIARIYTFRKNRSDEYTRKRLTSRKSWEHRSLKAALKLYGKAAKAGNRRAKREIAMVKQLMRGELRSFFRGPRAKKLPGDGRSYGNVHPAARARAAAKKKKE